MFATAQMQTNVDKTRKKIRWDLQFLEVIFKKASCALKVASDSLTHVPFLTLNFSKLFQTTKN